MSTAPITIHEGDLITHDPDTTKLYHFDWTDKVGEGVSIASAETVIAVLRPKDATLAAAALAALEIENETTSGLFHQVELATPQMGAKYKITSRITTSETPSQTLDGSFFLVGQAE